MSLPLLTRVVKSKMESMRKMSYLSNTHMA